MRIFFILLAAGWLGGAGLWAAEVRFSLRSDPRTMDPLAVSDQASEAVRYLTTARLVRVHAKTRAVEPELAASWKLSAGNRVLTFRLRPGVKFSDGTPFAGRDVVHTLRALLDAKRNLPAGEELRTLPIVSVESPKADEVVVKFAEALAAPALYFSEIPMVPASGAAAGLGPFRVAQYERGRQIRFEKNPHYWKGTGYPVASAVVVEILPSAEIERGAWTAGRLDFLETVDPAFFDQIAGTGAARDSGPTAEAEVLWFNLNENAPIPAHKKAWFQNREFRRAISRLIRREDLARIVYRGRGTGGSGPFLPGSPWAVRRPAAAAAKVEEVVAGLARIGFRRDGGGVMRDGAGNAVEISIATNASNRARMQILSLLQADLGRAGIKVTPAGLDMPSLLERMGGSKSYEAIVLGLTGVSDDPNQQMTVWLSSSANHPWRPGQAKPATAWEAEIDDLLRRQVKTVDVGKRKGLLERFQRIVDEESPLLYLVHPHALSAVSPKLKNAAPGNHRPRVFWNIDQLEGGR